MYDSNDYDNSSEGESTTALAERVTNEPKQKRFKFRSLEELNKVPDYGPSSSPIPLPSPEKFNISSDEELEKSMILFEQQISEKKEETWK